MSDCIAYTVLHENKLGIVGYCFGCRHFHLKMNGLLTVVSDKQLLSIENRLESLRHDLETNHDAEGQEMDVQINITKNTYLCLTYEELVDGLELICLGRHMKTVTNLVV